MVNDERPLERDDTEFASVHGALSALGRATATARPRPGFSARVLARVEARIFRRQAAIALAASALVTLLGVRLLDEADTHLAAAVIAADDAPDGVDP